MRLLLRWLIIAAAVYVVAALLPGVTVTGGFGSLLLVAAIFAVVNLLVGPVLRLLALPFTLLTLGLFLIVVNGALFALTAALTRRLEVDGFVTAMIGALIISAVTWVLERVLGLKR